MDGKKTPSPALVIAVLALFVSLSGTAVAAGVVPLAKRALSADKAKQADNAKLLGGQAAAAIIAKAAQTPGPASSAAGLVSVKTAPWSLAPKTGNEFVVLCDAGQKAIAAGFEDPGGYAHAWDTRPTSDGAGWRTYVSLAEIAPGQQTGTLYAVCVR
jgi:hypothetical protein